MATGAASPFQPTATSILSASTVSANAPLLGSGDCVLITNLSSAVAYIRFGSDTTVQATTADTPILPNSKILLRCGPLVSYCAAILGSGGGSVAFTHGDGSTT